MLRYLLPLLDMCSSILPQSSEYSQNTPALAQTAAANSSSVGTTSGAGPISSLGVRKRVASGSTPSKRSKTEGDFRDDSANTLKPTAGLVPYKSLPQPIPQVEYCDFLRQFTPRYLDYLFPDLQEYISMAPGSSVEGTVIPKNVEQVKLWVKRRAAELPAVICQEFCNIVYKTPPSGSPSLSGSASSDEPSSDAADSKDDTHSPPSPAQARSAAMTAAFHIHIPWTADLASVVIRWSSCPRTDRHFYLGLQALGH